MLISSPLYAAMGVCYDASNNITKMDADSAQGLFYTQTANCKFYDAPANGVNEPQTKYLNESSYLTLRNRLRSTPGKHLKWDSNLQEPVEKTQAEKDAIDAAEITSAETALKIAAKTAVTNRDEIMLASRSGLRVAYKSLLETRNAINALIDHLNNPLQNPIPEKLPNRTWAQVITATKNEIDNETDPNT